MTQTTVRNGISNSSLIEKGGKYLTFSLENEEYGLEIAKVRQIIGHMEITSVPQMPDHIKGIINLRGQIIPVLDLRAKFGMPTVDVTNRTCIIVVEISRENQKFEVGIVVDCVQEVIDIEGENIEQTPQFDSGINTYFILGIGKVQDNVKILLDIDEVVSCKDFSGFTFSETD